MHKYICCRFSLRASVLSSVVNFSTRRALFLVIHLPNLLDRSVKLRQVSVFALLNRPKCLLRLLRIPNREFQTSFSVLCRTIRRWPPSKQKFLYLTTCSRKSSISDTMNANSTKRFCAHLFLLFLQKVCRALDFLSYEISSKWKWKTRTLAHPMLK